MAAQLPDVESEVAPARVAKRGVRYLGRRYGIADGESILDALLRQGATVAYSCRKGSCHTCVLKCERGDVAHDRAVDAELLRSGHVLACVAKAGDEVALAPPDASRMLVAAEIVSRRALTADIFEIGIAPMRELDYDAGQHLQVVRDDGLSRPYSIACLPGEDYFLTVHVRRMPGGAMSGWLCEETRVGDRVSLLAPRGECRYRPAMVDRPLLLLATGSGAGAMASLARQAIAGGHRASIALYHGVRDEWDLYLHDVLTALAQRHPAFTYVPCVSGSLDAGGPHAGARAGRVVDAAFAPGADLADVEMFLCGLPAMVEEARYRAALFGVPHARIHADPFDDAEPAQPRDAEKIAGIEADPDLWDELERGPRLTRILESFYARVYVDARLSPFFQGIPRDHVIAKQYAFLADLFSGARGYFGMNPFNAHHWMVISDELFGYREALFEEVLREHALPAPMIRRWIAMHEWFRAEIVKAAPRGMVSRGVEQPLRTHRVERLPIDAVCDGCGDAIPAGAPSRYQYRQGTLHCALCGGLEA